MKLVFLFGLLDSRVDLIESSCDSERENFQIYEAGLIGSCRQCVCAELKASVLAS